MSDDIQIKRHAGWVELLLNRPERRNAIIPPVSYALSDALDEIAEDDSVAAVLLGGNGGYFCSGVDLKALQADPPPPWKSDHGNSWRQLHIKLFSFPKPVVGALERYAINAGAALAMACDVLIAGESAFLQVGEIQQGADAPMNAAWLKIKSTETVAARLAFYGDRVDGKTLAQLGLATEVVADDEVHARAQTICESLAGHPPGAARTIKEAIIAQRGIDDADAFFRQSGSTALLNASLLRE